MQTECELCKGDRIIPVTTHNGVKLYGPCPLCRPKPKPKHRDGKAAAARSDAS